MSKKWVKYYLLIGTIMMLVLAFSGSHFFLNVNLNQAEQKRTFESIYTDTSIDFVIPSPTQQQIQELDHSPDSGIEVITPYYTTKAVSINGAAANKGVAILFPEKDKLEYTPYVSARVLKGKSSFDCGDAIVDNMFLQLNHCAIDDKVSVTLAGNNYEFSITSIVEDNTLFKEGTVALILSADQNEYLIQNAITYGSAYIKASDYTRCKDYLYNEYKPMGRLKEQSAFADSDSYSQYLEDFNNSDWSKEITNLKENYNTLKVKYENTESDIFFNNIVFAAIVALVIFVMNIYFASNKNIKKYMRDYLLKKNGTKSKIAGFYRKGIVFNLIVFAASCFALYFLSLRESILTLNSTLMNYIYPVGSALATSVLMVIITGIIVSVSYSMKKEKEPDQTAEQ